MRRRARRPFGEVQVIVMGDSACMTATDGAPRWTGGGF